MCNSSHTLYLLPVVLFLFISIYVQQLEEHITHLVNEVIMVIKKNDNDIGLCRIAWLIGTDLT